MIDIMIKKNCEDLGLKSLNINETFFKHYETYQKYSKERDDVVFYVFSDETLIVLYKGIYNAIEIDIDIKINKHMMKSFILKNRECLICYEDCFECGMCPQCGNRFCFECIAKIDKCPMCRFEFSQLE